jgi:CheY-like chemotaxis protein
MSDEAVDILLVEDNECDAELAIRVLGELASSHRVRRCRDGAEAVEFLLGPRQCEAETEATRPRVVFLDLKLPKVDGLDVLRRLKDDGRTRAIPIVVLTSSREDCDIAASYRLGANSYIVKPVDFDEFVAAVSELGRYWLLLNEQQPT